MLQTILYQFATKVQSAVAATTKAVSATNNFTLKNGKYLLPAKPKRLLSAYIIFANQVRSAQTGSLTQAAKKIGEAWAKLTPQDKNKYVQKANSFKAEHEKELQAYRELYQKPFKNLKLTITGYALQKIYQSPQKPKDLKDGMAKSKQWLSKLTPEQKLKIEEQIKSKRDQTQKNIEKFKLPVLEHDTQKKFMLAHCKDKKLSELTEAQREKLVKDYKKSVESHQAKLRDFALKFNLTLTQFQGLLIKITRKQAREKIKNKETKERLIQGEFNKLVQDMSKQGKIGKKALGLIAKKLNAEEKSLKKVAKTPAKPKVQAKRVKVAAKTKKANKTGQQKKKAATKQKAQVAAPKAEATPKVQGQKTEQNVQA